MELEELVNLIKVRDYVSNSINNYSIEKSIVNELGLILALLDKKIVGMIRNSDFKDYIHFDDAKKTMEDIVKMNNLKSSLSK